MEEASDPAVAAITTETYERIPQPLVYLSNLSYEATPVLVQALFAEEKITARSVEVIKKGVFGRQKSSGLAAVMLSNMDDVDLACSKVDGKLLLDRPVIVRRDKFEEDVNALDVKPKGVKTGKKSKEGGSAAATIMEAPVQITAAVQ